MAKVSVIVPVYNVEDYLTECLESIIEQTYRELEIICIDDCSTDRSLEILKEYAQRDSRIILSENQENCGQAYTRNRGMELATGDYILFVDSDDKICLDLIESCVKVSEGCDMVCFDYKQIIDRKEYPRQFAYRMEEGTYSGELYFTEAVCRDSIIFAPWSKMYSRHFLIKNNISFYNGIVYEDILFGFYCYVNAENVYSLNRKLYTYQIRSDSTMTGGVTEKSIGSYVICICELTRIYLQTEYNQKMNHAIEEYIRKVCREYIGSYRKWTENQQIPELLKDRPKDLKLFHAFSGLLANQGKISDLSPAQVEKIRQYQYVILYGAGDIARSTVEILDRYDISLYGIAVSDGHKKRDSLLGNPIRELSEYTMIRESCLVLIGTIPRYYEEIREHLQKGKFSDWLEVIETYGEEENERLFI